jgi:hypothetical protein
VTPSLRKHRENRVTSQRAAPVAAQVAV